jgi:arylsulfatase A-like enzyme/Flp pilus assembly protein TadD
MACLASAVASSSGQTAQAPPRARPNVVLITVDTLRADHLGCYGNSQVLTPNIDRLATEGIRFKTVVTAAPLTLPSHCSIMTGAYPMFHGVRDNVGYRLDSATETLAQIMKRRGYATGAIVGAYVLDRSFGLGTGFDFYYDHFDALADPRETINMAQLKRPGAEVVDRAISWIRQVQTRPFFLWAHLYDPHDPYDPPEPFKQRYAARPYDGEIAYVDQQVGRLFAVLKERGLYENTIVVLTGDHGESLGEHREVRHGYFIYDATLLVPLIIKPTQSSLQPRIISREVRSIDIAPTILQLLGFPKGSAMQGVSLSGLMSGKTQDIAPDAYSETFYPRQFGWSALKSLRIGNLKYIDAPRPELFELDRDPKELTNRASDRPAVVAEMKNKLKTLEESSSAGEFQSKAVYRLNPEQMEKLARLGYVGNPDGVAIPRSDAGNLADPKDEVETFYLINRAGVEAGSGHCDRAIPVLVELSSKAPNLMATYLMLGRCYFLEEKFEEAMKTFSQLQTMNPESLDAQFYIAACQFKLDDLPKAEEGFQKVLAVNPKRTYAHKYLGFIYQAQGKPELAISEFEKVIEISPDDLESHGKLGFLLASASRMTDALPHFQKVASLIPSDGSAHYNLGLAYEKLGDKSKAAQEFAKSCKLDKTLCGK